MANLYTFINQSFNPAQVYTREEAIDNIVSNWGGKYGMDAEEAEESIDTNPETYNFRELTMIETQAYNQWLSDIEKRRERQEKKVNGLNRMIHQGKMGPVNAELKLDSRVWNDPILVAEREGIDLSKYFKTSSAGGKKRKTKKRLSRKKGKTIKRKRSTSRRFSKR